MKIDIIKMKKRDKWSMCSRKDCFEDATWFVESDPYCKKHMKEIREKFLDENDNIKSDL